MTKSKVGAEPKGRVKHVFTKDGGIHEGIHRDEPGWYSNYHYYCFGYGYFFHRGKSLGEKLTPDYIRDNWDKAWWFGGLKESCMARIDRKRKIAVIKEGTEYAWAIERGLPQGYIIYKTDEDIPIYDITEPKNKKILINMYMKYLIKKYLNTFRNEFKVLNSISKQINTYSYIASGRDDLLKEINELVAKYKFIPKCKPLSDKPYYHDYGNIPFPSVNTILNDTLFNDEQKEYIRKCKFYTKFCLHKGISWKELDKKWSDEYVKEVEAKDKVAEEAFKVRAEKAKERAEINRKNAKALKCNTVSDWRNGNRNKVVKWIDYYADYSTRTIKQIELTEYSDNFPNTQLRLKPGKPNWVETSRGALVPLETAINVFNRLYTDYILSGKTIFKFTRDEFRIGSFCVSSISYEDKFVDFIEYGQDETNKLGYKEWKFCIGCHILWFDDIKDFARYYNLQDRLSFPLDKTTAECMENHLIHLSSGRTIKAVGTMDI
jgi:hypothetical protein